MHLFFKIKDQRVDLLPNNPKSGHFQSKNGKNGIEWPKVSFFTLILYYHASRVSSYLRCGYSLEVRGFIAKNTESSNFSLKMAQKFTWMAKIPNFFILILYDHA